MRLGGDVYLPRRPERAIGRTQLIGIVRYFLEAGLDTRVGKPDRLQRAKPPQVSPIPMRSIKDHPLQQIYSESLSRAVEGYRHPPSIRMPIQAMAPRLLMTTNRLQWSAL